MHSTAISIATYHAMFSRLRNRISHTEVNVAPTTNRISNSILSRNRIPPYFSFVRLFRLFFFGGVAVSSKQRTKYNVFRRKTTAPTIATKVEFLM